MQVPTIQRAQRSATDLRGTPAPAPSSNTRPTRQQQLMQQQWQQPQLSGEGIQIVVDDHDMHQGTKNRFFPLSREKNLMRFAWKWRLKISEKLSDQLVAFTKLVPQQWRACCCCTECKCVSWKVRRSKALLSNFSLGRVQPVFALSKLLNENLKGQGTMIRDASLLLQEKNFQ